MMIPEGASFGSLHIAERPWAPPPARSRSSVRVFYLCSPCSPYGYLSSQRNVVMKCHPVIVFATATVGSLLLACPAHAQSRSRTTTTTTIRSVQQHYGIRDAYDGTS